MTPLAAEPWSSHEAAAAAEAWHGTYGLSTTELVEFLRERIEGRSAIEIRSGDGVLAQTLGIPAIGNRQQEDPVVRAHYDLIRPPVERYGEHVEKLDGAEVVAKYKPAQPTQVGILLTNSWFRRQAVRAIVSRRGLRRARHKTLQPSRRQDVKRAELDLFR